MKMKADTARGRGSFALQAVPVRFEFVAGAARGKQVRKACGSTTLFTDTHVINSATNRPRSAGRSAVKISRVRTHRPGPTRQPHTDTSASVSQSVKPYRIRGKNTSLAAVQGNCKILGKCIITVVCLLPSFSCSTGHSCRTQKMMAKPCQAT
jgi:hypothetical protein